jgi:Flp pilus assembly protein TadG
MRPGSSLRHEDGQAAAEFALVLPILCALILAIAQFGIAFNNYLTITDAVRAGARVAAVSRFTADNGAAAKLAVLAAAPNLDQVALTAGTSVTATPNWAVAGSDVIVTASYPYSINILGWVVQSGSITSTTRERLE